jgi:hypothetical protein
MDYVQAKKDLAAAQTEVAKQSADPNSLKSRIALGKLKEAEARTATLAETLGFREKTYNMRAHGTDENGNPLAGAMMDDSGHPVGTALQQNVRPTGSERSKADLANSAHDQIQDMKKLVDQIHGQFGPIAGRETEFKTWLGSQDPLAQRFRAARTIAGDHLAGVFGGRSARALTQIDNAIGQFKDSPEAVKAGLDQLDKANNSFLQKGTVKTFGSKAAATSSNDPLGIR